MEVYFIQCGKYVKIGKSHHSYGRFKALQTSNPYPLRLLAVAEDADGLEAILHKQMKRWHHRGEWFKYTPTFQVKFAIILAESGVRQEEYGNDKWYIVSANSVQRHLRKAGKPSARTKLDAFVKQRRAALGVTQVHRHLGA